MGRDSASGQGLSNTYLGLLIGTAVGDSIGLPAEGMDSERIRRLYGGRWKQRLLPGCGTVSDDTDHTFLTARSLLEHPRDAAKFQKSLARSLRLWLATLPFGIGGATLKSICRLWLGYGTKKSGVRSAGNGPAMRMAIVGAFHHDSPERLRQYVDACTTLSHTDPRALTGAMAVATIASGIAGGRWKSSPPDNVYLLEKLKPLAPEDGDWQAIVDSIIDARTRKLTLREYALGMGLGESVSGYTYHTVPIALYAWIIHHGDFRATVEAVLNAGGDTDTVAAIAGALAGAVTGPGGIPGDWKRGLIGWPVTAKRLRRLSDSLASPSGPSRRLPFAFFILMGIRNVIAMPVILCHALRRLLPPY